MTVAWSSRLYSDLLNYFLYLQFFGKYLLPIGMSSSDGETKKKGSNTGSPEMSFRYRETNEKYLTPGPPRSEGLVA
jgi:hypothetical protein